MPLFRRLWKYFADLAWDFRSLFQPLTHRFLCDTCENDYGNACVHPQRPNALKCPDYRKRTRA